MVNSTRAKPLLASGLALLMLCISGGCAVLRDLGLGACGGHVRPCRGHRSRCEKVYAIDPVFYGYHPTCWRPWPEGWGCPPPEQAGGIAADEIDLPGTEWPELAPPELLPEGPVPCTASMEAPGPVPEPDRIAPEAGKGGPGLTAEPSDKPPAESVEQPAALPLTQQKPLLDAGRDEGREEREPPGLRFPAFYGLTAARRWSWHPRLGGGGRIYFEIGGGREAGRSELSSAGRHRQQPLGPLVCRLPAVDRLLSSSDGWVYCSDEEPHL